MRTLVFLLSLSAATAAAAAPPVMRTVDLETAAGRRALEQADAAHRQKVVAILEEAERHSCEMLPRILPARFAVEEARCQNRLLMTSDPPKRRLEFTLDQTRYQTVIRLVGNRGGVIPAK